MMENEPMKDDDRDETGSRWVLNASESLVRYPSGLKYQVTAIDTRVDQAQYIELQEHMGDPKDADCRVSKRWHLSKE